MTCIVGVEHGDDVWIGGDSAGVGGWTMTVRADEKVFRVGEYLYGIAGSFRMGNVIRYGFTAPLLHEGEEVASYMPTRWVDALRQCMGAAGQKKVTNGVDRLDDGSFLVGFRGALYMVDPDFQVGRSRVGYLAMGSGEDVALGSLFATPDMAPKRRIKTALRAAEAHNIGVRGPFVVERLGTVT